MYIRLNHIILTLLHDIMTSYILMTYLATQLRIWFPLLTTSRIYHTSYATCLNYLFYLNQLHHLKVLYRPSFYNLYTPIITIYYAHQIYTTNPSKQGHITPAYNGVPQDLLIFIL